MPDVIVSFFARPGGPGQVPAEVAQPTSGFASPPLIVNAPMAKASSNAAGFAEAMKRLRNPATGRVLPNLLRSLNARPEGGRVALVSFSAGRAGLQEVIRHEADRDAVDVVIDIDGLHMQKGPSGYPVVESIQPWILFGTLALDGSHLLVCQHTAIATPSPQVTSTTESANVLFQNLGEIAQHALLRPQNVDPAALTAGPPPPAVTIRGQSGDRDRTYDAMPPLDVRHVGNAWRIGMPGNTAGAHIFACYYLQAAIIRGYLWPRWNAGTGCTVASV